MYITPHATIGIIIGEHTGNPILAFIFGVFSHFICDIIPHGDTQFDAWADRTFTRHRKAVLVVSAGIDYVALLTMLWFIAPTTTFTPSVIASTVGTIAPDVTWAWYEISKWKILAAYKRMHGQCHEILKRDIPYWLGLLYQILLVAFLVSIRS
jgi:hypothetical protein